MEPIPAIPSYRMMVVGIIRLAMVTLGLWLVALMYPGTMFMAYIIMFALAFLLCGTSVAGFMGMYGNGPLRRFGMALGGVGGFLLVWCFMVPSLNSGPGILLIMGIVSAYLLLGWTAYAFEKSIKPAPAGFLHGLA